MEERHEEIVLTALKQVQGKFAHVWPDTVDLAIPLKTMSTFQVYATLERLRIQGKIQISPEEKITCCEGLPTTPASGDPPHSMRGRRRQPGPSAPIRKE